MNPYVIVVLVLLGAAYLTYLRLMLGEPTSEKGESVPEQVLDDQLEGFRRDLVKRAMDSGKIVIANLNQDGSVTYEELEPGVDWPDNREIDEILKEGSLDQMNKELDEDRTNRGYGLRP